MDNGLLTAFIVIIGLAFVTQALVMVLLFVYLKQTGQRMEAMLGEIQKRALPVLEKLGTVSKNLAASSVTLRAQVERMDSALTDLLDRSRLQVIRADELVSSTLDRIEETTELMQETVVVPVRQFAGIFSGVTAGLTAGLGALFSRRRAPAHNGGVEQDEELFI